MSYQLLKSRTIFTGVDREFLDGYVVIKNDTIIGVYPVQELPAFFRNQRVIDYQDNTILPGFIEAHAHVQLSALLFNGMIKSITGSSEEECAEHLWSQRHSARFINGWFIAKGWYLPQWTHQRLPSKKSLDHYFKNYPVMVLSEDLHTIWLNSVGLTMVKDFLNKDSPDVVLENGELSGVIKEKTAMSCLNRLLDFTVSQREVIYRNYLNALARQGYTTVCDLALLPVKSQRRNNDQIFPEVYQALAEKNQLPLRVCLFPFFDDQGQRIKQLRKSYQHERLTIAGGKQFFDGVISSQTAWLKAPYEQSHAQGAPIIAPQTLKQFIDCAQKEQIPLRVHTIGDQASAKAIALFLEAKEEFGPLTNGNHCLEHLERIEKEDIAGMKQAQLIASVQPSHPLMDYQKVQKDIGKRSEYMWPLKDLKAAGVALAFGSDSPVVRGIHPLENIYYAMTRKTKGGQPKEGWQNEQCLSLADSLSAHTQGASKACSAEEQIGTLEAGKQADLVVIEGNLTGCSVEELLQLSIVTTMVGGKKTYEKKEGIAHVQRTSNF